MNDKEDINLGEEGGHMSIEQDLFFALYSEHKRLTGHDVYTRKRLTFTNCDTCLYLDKIRLTYDELERQHYEDGVRKEAT